VGQRLIIEDLSGAGIPIRRDKRGIVADLSGFCIRGMHVLTMEAGAVRGNHVHNRDEIITVIGGGKKCEIVAEDQDSDEEERQIVKGNLNTYRIKSGVKHIIRNVSAEQFYLVCFYEGSSIDP